MQNTEERNEELAKLLGIERKTICQQSADLYGCGDDINGEFCKKCIHKENSELRYPDFTKPSNFVKLLEMEINCDTDRYETLGELVWYLGGETTSRQTFINCVESLFNENSMWFDEKRNKIINQQAQQTEWEY